MRFCYRSLPGFCSGARGSNFRCRGEGYCKEVAHSDLGIDIYIYISMGVMGCPYYGFFSVGFLISL